MKNEYKRVLTIQDISCVGQCSLTVALPILSACGMETVILPSAVLSTHTGGFKNFHVKDLTDEIPAIKDHWISEGISFDAIYTGYLGSTKQIGYVKDIFSQFRNDGCIVAVDPAMADNGVLYYGFDDEYVRQMRTLCTDADYILPNITEACFLTGTEYRETYDKEYIDMLLERLSVLKCKNIILTGVSYSEDSTGVLVASGTEIKYYRHDRISRGCHGTGDIFASAFVGAIMHGKNAYDSAKIAADYTVGCIRYTQDYPDHWYGAMFEPVLGDLIKALD